MTRFAMLAGALAIGGLVAAAQPVQAQGAAPAVAQDQDHQEHHPQADQPPAAPPQQVQMMDMQKMMAEMKAMDATLDALKTKMNAATGEAKVDAIAELLTAIVQQRAAMHGRMMQMQSQMMGQMMQMHGQMMKQMGGAK